MKGKPSLLVPLSSMISFVFLSSLFSISLSFGNESISTPPCLRESINLPINNKQILNWKINTPNQFHERGHILGKIQNIIPDKTGHQHIEVRIGPNEDDTIEVIYNNDFGSTPKPYIGMKIEACGDYITANAKSGNYPASPDGAILHWVHINPHHGGHPSGFLIMDNVLCGQN
jgi:hypothetical protein